MSVLLKKELICNICQKIKYSPVLLPCNCTSICKEHLASNEKLRCHECKKTFQCKTVQLDGDKVNQAILNDNAHLTYDGKNGRLIIDKLFGELIDFVKEFQVKIVNFSLTQSNHFLRIKKDIEKEIDKIMNVSNASSRISPNERSKRTGLGK